ncbi:MAG: DUF1456 family protein [Gammaproteobacteria bacterium]|nr:DUF1456 family protein [Gammaproteobacteria bacterium]
MTNNDILRRLRYAFDLSDAQAAEYCSLDPSSTAAMDKAAISARLLADDDENQVPCSDPELCAFLDGLIVARRGLREGVIATPPKPADFRLSKNDILKKLRIAMGFREAEMLDTLSAGGVELSKSELGALFRSPGHKHYRTCGNQVLRAFIKGLTASQRS